jgi:hypothetical protein
VAQRVGMSAAIDPVDFCMQRGGVLSLSAGLRSTRLQVIRSGRRHRVASKSIACHASDNSTSAFLNYSLSASPQQFKAIVNAPRSDRAARGRPQAPRRSMVEVESQNG